MKLSPEIFKRAASLQKEMDEINESIVNRTDEIIREIFEIFNRKFRPPWIFEEVWINEERSNKFNLSYYLDYDPEKDCPHHIKFINIHIKFNNSAIWFIPEKERFCGSNNKLIRFNLCKCFPTRFLFSDFREEVIAGRKLAEKLQEEENIEKEKDSILEIEKFKSLTDKLSGEEISFLSGMSDKFKKKYESIKD